MRRFGIDLGTTNTCVYQANFTLGDPESFELNIIQIQYEDPGDFTNPPIANSMPSAIYGRRRGDTDKEEYNFYLGDVAILMADRDKVPEIINTKRLLCMEDPQKKIKYGLTAQDIAMKLLEGCLYSIKQKVRETQRKNAKYCITQPAAFGLFASRSIQDAAELAGIPNDKPLREPIAALLSFLYDQLSETEKATKLFERQQKHGGKLLTLVVDIGGGTTDVTIQEIKIEGTERPVQGNPCCTGYKIVLLNQESSSDGGNAVPVATANIEPAFGGLDFDKRIVTYIVEEWNKQYYAVNKHNYNWDSLNGSIELSKLYYRVQKYKNSLSMHLGEKLEYTESVKLDGIDVSCTIDADLVYKITNELCESRNGRYKSEKTVYGIIEDTVKRSGYRSGDIDYMFITGGMSSFKPIREIIVQKFTKMAYDDTIVFSKKPLDDIARGAALCDCYFEVDMPQSVLYADLMIDDPCGEPRILVPRNKALPAHGNEKNFMKLRNPVFLYVDVLSGLGVNDCDLKRLRRLRSRLPDRKITETDTEISVEWEIDAHQGMNVNLTVHDASGEYKVELLQLIKGIDISKGE